MSRIGKMNICVPDGIKIRITDDFLVSKGELSSRVVIPKGIRVSFDNNIIKVFRENDSNVLKALHGLTRKLIYNSVMGFLHPFQKVLQIKGVGFKANISGNILTLVVGYSHPVNVNIPKEISVKIDSKQNQIFFESYDKNVLGEFVANIRAVRPPEPYKGTGIMYIDEKIIRKAGKSASSKK